MRPKDRGESLPPALSFTQALEQVRQEQEQAKATQSELGHIAWKRVQCFKACCEIVFGSEGNLRKQVAQMLMVDKFDEDKQHTANWPRSSEFITFGGFHVEAASALAVMSSFCRSVRSCSIMAQCSAIHKHDLTTFTDDDVDDLWRATRLEARAILDADKWPSGATYRDRRILERRVITELWAATHEPVQAPLEQFGVENLEGPYEPNTWRRADGIVLEGTMTPSAFALVKYLWNQKDWTAEVRDIIEDVFDDKPLELRDLRQYGKSANNLFRDKVPWSIVTSEEPIAKVCLVNRPPKPKKNRGRR